MIRTLPQSIELQHSLQYDDLSTFRIYCNRILGMLESS